MMLRCVSGGIPSSVMLTSCKKKNMYPACKTKQHQRSTPSHAAHLSPSATTSPSTSLRHAGEGDLRRHISERCLGVPAFNARSAAAPSLATTSGSGGLGGARAGVIYRSRASRDNVCRGSESESSSLDVS